MYRVILIDDEPWTLQGINETFQWNQYGFEVIGAYTFATVALQEILEKKPDVVFTDIRMPVINGIEILNTIREKQLETEVIIISGYGQFDYAQGAIRQGAFDYILKPIDEGITGELLERLKNKLDQKEAERNRMIINMLLEGPEEIELERCGLQNQYPYYQAIAWCSIHNSEMKEYLQKIPDLNFMEIKLSDRIYFIVNCCNDLFEVIEKEKFAVSVGLSKLSPAMGSVQHLISQASIAAAYRFITNQNRAYLYQDIQSRKLIPFIKGVVKTLNEGRLVDFTELAEQIPQLFLEKGYSVEDLCILMNKIIVNVEMIFPTRFQNSALDLCDWQQLEYKFSGIDAMIHTLIDEVQYCFGHTEFDLDNETDIKSINFNNILKFLNNNYHKQLKLKDLSQMFYINKNYACFLFKRYTGMTYSEYLNKLRMENAKEMLVATSYTIAEVSEKSGYVDYFYFCKLFKKTYGVTPTQYRQRPIELAN